MKSTQAYIHMMVSPNCSLWGTMGAYSTEICPCGRERVNYAVRKGVRDSYCQKSSHLVHQQQGQYLGGNSHRDSTTGSSGGSLSFFSTVIVGENEIVPKIPSKKATDKIIIENGVISCIRASQQQGKHANTRSHHSVDQESFPKILGVLKHDIPYI